MNQHKLHYGLQTTTITVYRLGLDVGKFGSRHLTLQYTQLPKPTKLM